jgi:hypothetical protein
VRYLQIGGDTWNRCHEGWMNIDAAFKQEGLGEHQLGTDDKGAHNMALTWSNRAVLPFVSESVQLGASPARSTLKPLPESDMVSCGSCCFVLSILRAYD